MRFSCGGEFRAAAESESLSVDSWERRAAAATRSFNVASRGSDSGSSSWVGKHTNFSWMCEWVERRQMLCGMWMADSEWVGVQSAARACVCVYVYVCVSSVLNRALSLAQMPATKIERRKWRAASNVTATAPTRGDYVQINTCLSMGINMCECVHTRMHVIHNIEASFLSLSFFF